MFVYILLLCTLFILVEGGHQIPFNGTFSCPKLPQVKKATNVRQLRPQDIEVVMAVGDSMTAGNLIFKIDSFNLIFLFLLRIFYFV